MTGITLHGAPVPGGETILTDAALAFIAHLHRMFDPTRQSLLRARDDRKRWWQAGNSLDFAPETSSVRDGHWQISGTPADLLDRRVEITGPCDRKMVINALNSGAKCFMACMEDATSPTWHNIIDGQINLRDAVHRTINLEDKGKSYKLNDIIATLIFRPRGWHLPETHIRVDGEEVSGAIVDFALYFFHNARRLVENGSGPYFYLPKMEHYLEARLWNNIFVTAQSILGLPLGTIKSTVLIETLPGAFMADEILYELRDHIVALNCGRWDYIFSYIKCLGHDANSVLPDRSAVTMASPFMAHYAAHVVRTCHRRNAHAMGGMSAFIPVKDDEAKNSAAFAAVKADKEREATLGHDGTWVAHPGLVGVAMEVFDRLMPGASQREKIPAGTVSAAELLAAPEGPKTRAGLAMNINVAIGYIAAWLRGQGAVPLHNMMEDAATAEISRTQLWQWRTQGVTLDSGETVTAALINAEIQAQLAVWKDAVGDNFFATGRYAEAATILSDLVLAKTLPDFLTTPCYRQFMAA
ncbi:malate synthase A [Sandaracinobacteroides saxicola]|uniref:malate synthase n=1 Tax=Sandaracinobacteroides saxicola TaxID=2759707 RepID=A0A7G5IK62_9SPHN|nr:malate synthase A [Sandaracinobacteroides saxicola]QMW23754.1 malate synthase A [Sandaracinobacteroides saxicola]